MADSHAKNHDYHLVNPSWWPFVGAIAACVTAVGRRRIEMIVATANPAILWNSLPRLNRTMGRVRLPMHTLGRAAQFVFHGRWPNVEGDFGVMT